MSWFERWFLKRVFAREVQQGPDHPRRIADLYGMIREAAENEFTEDNKPSRDAYLREWFERGLSKP